MCLDLNSMRHPALFVKERTRRQDANNLGCFLVGMSLSVLAFIGRSFHLPHLHLHLPHGRGLPTHPGMAPSVLNRAGMPHINFATVTAFLTWFGAAAIS